MRSDRKGSLGHLVPYPLDCLVVIWLQGCSLHGGAWTERPPMECPLNISTQMEHPLDIYSNVILRTCDILTPVDNVPEFYLCLRVDILSLVTSCLPSFTWFVTFCPSVTYFQPVSCCLFPMCDILSLCDILPLCFYVPFSHSVTFCPCVFGVTSCLCICVCVCVRESTPTHGSVNHEPEST